MVRGFFIVDQKYRVCKIVPVWWKMSFVKGDFCCVAVSSSEVDMSSSVVVVFVCCLGCSRFHASLLLLFSCVMVSRTVSNKNCVFMDWISVMAVVINGGSKMLFGMGAITFMWGFPGWGKRWDCSSQLMKTSIVGTVSFLILKMRSGFIL